VTRRTALVLLVLAFVAAFTVAANAGDSPATKPAATRSAPLAEESGKAADLSLTAAETVPPLRDPIKPKPKPTPKHKPKPRVTPAPVMTAPTATPTPAWTPTPTATPQYVAPAPRYVPPRRTATPKPAPTAPPEPSGDFDSSGDTP